MKLFPKKYDKSSQISPRAAYARLWREWIASQRYIFLLSFVFMILVAVSAAGYAKSMELVIDALEKGVESVIWWGPLMIITLTMIKGISHYLQQILQNHVLSRMQMDMQDRMFARLITMDLSNLMNEKPAALAARFSADIEVIRNATRDLFGSVTAILTIIATFGVMISIDWALTVGLFCIFLLAFGPVGIAGARVRAVTEKTQNEIADMTSSVNEGLAAIRMVRTYRLEKRLLSNASETFKRLFRLRLSFTYWQASLSPLMEIISGLAIGALLFLVAWRMQMGAIDLAGFIGLLTALGVATTPARRLGMCYASALQGVAALDRVYKLLDMKNLIKGGRYAYKQGKKAKGEIEFRNVNFTYPDGFHALKDVNIRIEAGKSIAFVGRSGAGKSTFFNLLPRLFDVSSGEILLDGKPITNFTLNALRDQISVVGQDSVMLSGTIKDNIRFGREDASDKECVKAAQFAAAHDFIEQQAQGYETILDPSHISLSGGQRQRLSIARAMLRNAPILLLDEPTSALDGDAEHHIRMALARLSKGRTTLIIAHRLSTIMDADSIVVMDQGMIVDQGNHSDLLRRGGVYAQLFNMQDETIKRPTRHQNDDVSWQTVIKGMAKWFS